MNLDSKEIKTLLLSDEDTFLEFLKKSVARMDRRNNRYEFIRHQKQNHFVETALRGQNCVLANGQKTHFISSQ